MIHKLLIGTSWNDVWYYRFLLNLYKYSTVAAIDWTHVLALVFQPYTLACINYENTSSSG